MKDQEVDLHSNEYEGEEIEIEAIGIDVTSQPIELYKVFKIANLVGGGGEAKHIISEGYVAVNGELETRKRRKMYDGDFFEFNQEYYVVVCDQPVSEEEPLKKAADKPKKEKQAKKASKNKPSKPKKSDSFSTSGLSQSAKPRKKDNPKKNKKSENTATVGKEPESKPTKDANSGRGSIDFF
ncbi:RNA-binding S4 domain-containing protein [Vibrio sp. ZSDZ34]|jgi:ribosome-associated protein|uniref:RNA-binding S4 domain-containing protein n=1 Tax=Vibrio gelatinilyticus TaxID=2893468 RepID=A0A9X1WBY2_9VIBR|nr:RNA-binding S4 domain-containing protein [Vibrio gelatinilyticus]MCJ2376328.1 RNA-binding S4 domain-containing protein [Vibrio gelatinilyticus]